MMRIIACLAVLIMALASAEAQLSLPNFLTTQPPKPPASLPQMKVTLQNCRTTTITLAVTWSEKRGDKSFYVSRGWFKVGPGQSYTYPFPSTASRNQRVYIRYNAAADDYKSNRLMNLWPNLRTGAFCAGAGAFTIETDYAQGYPSYNILKNTYGPTGYFGRNGCAASNRLSMQKYLTITQKMRGRDNTYTLRSGCTK